MNAQDYKRIVAYTQTFKVNGTFQSMYAAQRYLIDNGYGYGSTSKNRISGCCEPVAIVKGEYNLPQKWHNLSKEDKAGLAGLMQSNDFREGEVVITFFK